MECCGVLLIFVCPVHFWLKSDKSNEQFVLSVISTLRSSGSTFIGERYFQTLAIEKEQTHFIFSSTFPKALGFES